MAFCFVVGSKDFTSQLKGYEGVTAQCQNCGNWSAHCISSWDWFTFCWLPILPLGKKHQDIACSICRFRQDMRNRPDVQSQQGQTVRPPQQGQQGFGGPPPPHQQGQPQYK